MKKSLAKKTISELKIEETLCEKLDVDVYIPVKEELKNCNVTYSLGMRKEDFNFHRREVPFRQMGDERR